MSKLLNEKGEVVLSYDLEAFYKDNYEYDYGPFEYYVGDRIGYPILFKNFYTAIKKNETFKKQDDLFYFVLKTFSVHIRDNNYKYDLLKKTIELYKIVLNKSYIKKESGLQKYFNHKILKVGFSEKFKDIVSFLKKKTMEERELLIYISNLLIDLKILKNKETSVLFDILIFPFEFNNIYINKKIERNMLPTFYFN